MNPSVNAVNQASYSQLLGGAVDVPVPEGGFASSFGSSIYGQSMRSTAKVGSGTSDASVVTKKPDVKSNTSEGTGKADEAKLKSEFMEFMSQIEDLT